MSNKLSGASLVHSTEVSIEEGSHHLLALGGCKVCVDPKSWELQVHSQYRSRGQWFTSHHPSSHIQEHLELDYSHL